MKKEEMEKYRRLPRGVKLSIFLTWIINLAIWMFTIYMAKILPFSFFSLFVVISGIIFLLIFFILYPLQWKWAWENYQKKQGKNIV